MWTINNDGKQIIATDYWQSEECRQRLFAASVNAGAIRLLIPSAAHSLGTTEQIAGEMSAGVDSVLVVRGIVRGKVTVTLLFDDHSRTPYMLTLDARVFDVLPSRDDHGRDMTVIGYMPGLVKVFEFPATFRYCDGAPDLL